jgi:CBS domain-containing protein
MLVREIMTRGAECISLDGTVREAAEKMRHLNVGTLPVLDRGRLVGVVTDRDITVRATALGWRPECTPVRDVMTPEILFCFDDQNVTEAAALMRDKQVRRLIVLDREQRITGILSLGDLACAHDGALVVQTLEAVCQTTGPHRGKLNGKNQTQEPASSAVSAT